MNIDLTRYDMTAFMRDLTVSREGMTRPVAFDVNAETRNIIRYRKEAALRGIRPFKLDGLTESHNRRRRMPGAIERAPSDVQDR